jgi:predicted PurR-regulated permease PerM
VVGSQIHNLATELPNHRKEIEAKIATLRNGGGAFDDLLQMFREIAKPEVEPKTTPGDILGKEKEVIVTRPEEPSSAEKIYQAVVPVLEPLVHAGFVLVLVVFMLFHREDLRNRFIGLLGDGRLTGTTRVIVDSAHRLSRYLLTQSLVNFSFGAIFAVGLYFMNVEYAILWGFVTALMRFIPYIGTWISVLLPLTLSFATAPTWAQPLEVLVYFGILDVATANVVEPLLMGHRTGVSPIALLIAAAFWTWFWGPMGLVLSTPMTVCLVVIGQHVPRLRFFALLLGDQPPLEPKVRYYQRLLARDEVEAKEVAVEYAKAEGLEKVYDNVLLPALAMARQDRQDAGLEAEDEEFIIKATREILSSLEMKPPAAESAEPLPMVTDDLVVVDDMAKSPEPDLQEESRVLILGCPAHQQAEELALQMLGNLLKPEGCEVEVASTRALPAEIEAEVAQMTPALVFIAVLPPGGLVQARYLCKRLRKRFADLSIVVGYWGEAGDFDKLVRQVRSAGGNYVATSLLQARSQIEALIHPATTDAAQPETPALQEV